MGRFTTAWNAFWSILRSQESAERWQQAIAAKTDEQPKLEAGKPAAKPHQMAHADAVYTLALLQREGRFIDFLQEDISAYADAQIGAAVRQIHENCRKVLQEHFGIQPVRDEDEGNDVEVPEGFDPRQIRVVGNTAGNPPFNGTLKHKGWKAARIQLPERHETLDPTIICPAEVEL